MKKIFFLALLSISFISIAQQTGVVRKGLLPMNPTTVQVASYTANINDYVVCNSTSSSFTITLPSAPPNNSIIGAKMVLTASNNSVTVNTSGIDVFNRVGGGTSLNLILQAQGAIMQYNSALAVWYITSDDLPLGGLDNRYWNINGNALSTNTNFIGSTTSQPLNFYTNNTPRFSIDGSTGAGTFTNSFSVLGTLFAANSQINTIFPTTLGSALNLQNRPTSTNPIIFSTITTTTTSNETARFTNQGFFGLGITTPRSLFEVAPSNTTTAQLFLWGSNKTPTISTLKNGMMWNDSTLNGVTEYYNSNAVFAHSWTNGNITLSSLNYTAGSVYDGAWFGTSSNHNLNLFANSGSNVPSLTILKNAAVVINPVSYTNTAALTINAGGQDAFQIRNNTDVNTFLKVTSVGDMFMNHLGGMNTTAVTATVGAGGGVSTGGTFTLTNCNDLSGLIGVTTGSNIIGVQTVFITVTFGRAFTTAPHVVLFAANQNFANLSATTNMGFFVTTTTTAMVVHCGAVNVANSTIISFNYQIVQ